MLFDRYLVVIDDLQQAGWLAIIQRTLAKVNTQSRIIVTTSIRSVAAICRPGSHIIRMQGLDHSDSEKLFVRTFGRQLNPTPAQEHAFPSILHQCGGLPMAVISLANYLRGEGPKNLTERMAKVGSHLAGGPGSIEGMNRAFIKDYNSLPDSVHRTCLLYLSTFPTGHLIKRKSLIRRWIAEGLVVGDGGHTAEEVADDCFDNLIDRNIIEPVSIGINSMVKSCRVNDFLHLCIVNRSVSKNFVTMIRQDQPYLSGGASPVVRRLSVHGGTIKSRKVAMEMGLNRVRSLTISRGVTLDFRACRLLRVLDLEGCNQIGDGVLTVICTLVLLKYLGLRDTNVCKIPSAIRNLSGLETLDMRKTQVDLSNRETTAVELPIDVFMFPRLSHLFGRFQLPQRIKNRKKRRTVWRFLSEESMLHTLSGFVMTGADDFDSSILLHMRRLKKLKIWMPRYTDSYLQDYLKSNNNALESFSMDFDDTPLWFMVTKFSCPMLSSIKLRGRLGMGLHNFIRSPANSLTELQLSHTGLPLEELSTLQKLHRLLYLKLAEDGDGFLGDTFVVQSDGFPSLERLCFEAPTLPRLHIVEGAMPALTSLHLLCEQPRHLRHMQQIDKKKVATSEIIEYSNQVWGIEYLKSLNDLVVHS